MQGLTGEFLNFILTATRFNHRSNNNGDSDGDDSSCHLTKTSSFYKDCTIDIMLNVLISLVMYSLHQTTEAWIAALSVYWRANWVFKCLVNFLKIIVSICNIIRFLICMQLVKMLCWKWIAGEKRELGRLPGNSCSGSGEGALVWIGSVARGQQVLEQT